MVHTGQAGHGAQQSALATAAGPQENEEFAVADVQRDIVDDRNALVALGHLIEGDGHIFRKGCDRKTDNATGHWALASVTNGL